MTNKPASFVNTEKPLTNFAYEIGQLRFIPRDFVQCGFPHTANVAEHVFRVSMLAWMIAEKEGANVGRTLQLALIHDIAETRTLDHGIVYSQYVAEREEAAATDMLSLPLPGGLDAWREYEARETLESKIVKDADSLDVVLEGREVVARGAQDPLHWADDYQMIGELLHTETARVLYKEIMSTHPLDWMAIFHQHRSSKLRANTTHKLKVA